MTTNAELKRLAEAIGGETWFQPDEGGADVWSCDPETDSEYPIRKRHSFNGQPFYEKTPSDEWYDAEQKLSDYITAANPARIIALVDEVERLREIARRVEGLWDTPIDFSTKVCCCGASMDYHSPYDGHIPTDEGEHFINSLVSDARQALATGEGE